MNTKIYFFSTAFSGGAGIAAKRLYDGLQKCSINHDLGYSADFEFMNIGNFAPKPLIGIAKWQQKIKTSLYYHNIEKQLAGRPAGLELFSPTILQHKTPFTNIKEANKHLLSQVHHQVNNQINNHEKVLLHLHWINGMIDIPSFFQSIPKTVPIVWTLHDFNTFTGGCHYPNACRNYETVCKNCMQLGTVGKANFAFQNQQIKYNSLKDRNLHIVTPSYWLQKEAEKSSVLAHAKSFQTISNGIDLEEFKPLNKQDCRKILDIAQDDFVLSFGAEKLDTTRKGLQYLWETLRILMTKNLKITLLLFGKNFFVPQEFSETINICYVGEVNKSVLQRIIYSAANVFVLPSLEDNQPLTCIESMSCGTPVLAFHTGGLPEMVLNHETGFTAVLENSQDLADKICYLYNNPEITKQLSKQARNFAVQNFDVLQQAKKHWELYERI